MILNARQMPIAEESDREWIAANAPLFECPDAEIEEIYYFRWGIYKKHVKNTPVGYVVTEFLPPVSWAGPYNTISCAAGHHIYEGRWLRNPKIMDDYCTFWFRHGGKLRGYSCWLADAIYNRSLVLGDFELAVDLLPDMAANYTAWEESNLHSCGLFWSHDNYDGGEFSISGDGFRPTLNSYMYGDASAIASIAGIDHNSEIIEKYVVKAAAIKRAVELRLWDNEAEFFKVFPLSESSGIRSSSEIPASIRGKEIGDWSFGKIDPDLNVRELHGCDPYYFNLPDPGYEEMWRQIKDPQGFSAPFGPPTAERRHRKFMGDHPHDCLWNGPTWPYSTTKTLVAMANLLNNYKQNVVDKADYLNLLKTYTKCNYARLPDGSQAPWIDENLHPDTGALLSREKKYIRNGPEKDQGKDYNHSGYCDLIISGLVGLRPRMDEIAEVNPLLPQNEWDYFALDNVPYHGKTLTIIWDKSGERYGKGKGLSVFADGQMIGRRDELGGLKAELK